VAILLRFQHAHDKRGHGTQPFRNRDSVLPKTISRCAARFTP
jgi:hypothetical protein